MRLVLEEHQEGKANTNVNADENDVPTGRRCFRRMDHNGSDIGSCINTSNAPIAALVPPYWCTADVYA